MVRRNLKNKATVRCLWRMGWSETSSFSPLLSSLYILLYLWFSASAGFQSRLGESHSSSVQAYHQYAPRLFVFALFFFIILQIRLSVSSISPVPFVRFSCLDGQIITDWVSGEWWAEETGGMWELPPVFLFCSCWLSLCLHLIFWRFHICQSDNANLCVVRVTFCDVVLFPQTLTISPSSLLFCPKCKF